MNENHHSAGSELHRFVQSAARESNRDSDTTASVKITIVLREDIRRVSDVVNGSAADCYVREVCLSVCLFVPQLS